MRVRTLVEKRWRNTFCWIARARRSVLDPVPLRDTERPIRVLRSFSKLVVLVFATLHSHKLHGTNVDRTIYRQVAIIAAPGLQPGQRFGCRSFDFFPTTF